uniref:hypothetical protein n=1 Tax=Pseudomonas sp. AU10 TaxID=882697 RepID=UPI0021E30E93
GKLELRRVFAHEKPQELDECPTSGAHFITLVPLIHRVACIAGKPAPTFVLHTVQYLSSPQAGCFQQPFSNRNKLLLYRS